MVEYITTLCDHVVQNNIEIKSNKEIAYVFNEFYISVGSKLASTIDDSNVDIGYDDNINDIGKKECYVYHANYRNWDNYCSVLI